MLEDSTSPWTLADHIDLELALSSWDGTMHEPIPEDITGRPAVIKHWLAAQTDTKFGHQSLDILSFFSVIFTALVGLAAYGAVWGILNRSTTPSSINVLWLLGVFCFLPWIFFVFATIIWFFRGRLPGNEIPAWILRKISYSKFSPKLRETLEKLATRTPLARTLGWRIAAWSQIITGTYHAGAALGLTTIVLFKKVGFFWGNNYSNRN